MLLIGNGIGPPSRASRSTRAGRRGQGEIAGLFSPYSLYRGSITALADGTSLAPPTGAGRRTAYVGVFVGISVACLAALIWRYRRVASDP